jgi:hypothetical protein
VVLIKARFLKAYSVYQSVTKINLVMPVLAILAFIACTAFRAGEETFDRSFTITGPVDLDVRSDPGGIRITAGSAPSFRVHAVLRPIYGPVDLGTAEENIQALERNPPIEQAGNHIRIGYVNDPELLRGVSMRLEIETPRTTQVHAYTTSGGIRVSGVDGPVRTETSSGRTDLGSIGRTVEASSHSGAVIIRGIGDAVSARADSGGIQILAAHGAVETETTSGRTEVSDVAGDIHSTTHSGTISIDNAKGTVVAHNNSGSIDAFQLTSAVQADTTSGAIRISQMNPAPIRARSHSGSIKVELADRAGYRLDAQSDSGRVSGPVIQGLEQITSKHRLKGQIGAGGPLIDLDTRSSRLEIN